MSLMRLLPCKEHPAYERVRAEIDAQAEAQRRLEEATAVVARYGEVARIGRDAARTAENSKRKASEARAAWARAGCPFSGGRELETLESSAQEDARVAERAARDADAVSKQLSRAEDTVSALKIELRAFEGKITDAFGVLLVEDQGSAACERVLQAADAFVTAAMEFWGLRHVVAPEYLAEDQTHKSPTASRLLDDVWRRVRQKIEAKALFEYAIDDRTGKVIREPRREVLASRDGWAARAAKLRDEL